MSTRLDLVLQKHPDHAEGVRALAERDPSGNLKYLAWGGAMLASGQALAPEVADVIDLFHRFAGQSLERTGVRRAKRQHPPSGRVHPDINAYRPQDFARLRDLLLKLKRAQDKKRKAREKLYRIEGPVEAELVYDSPTLIVRHIKNKNASIHYGHATKWCISMAREGYFDDYESHNATFFFFERKTPLGDEFDKVCLMMPRRHGDPTGLRGDSVACFNALDRQVDMFALAKVYGPRVFEIFRSIHEHSERYPGSILFRVLAGIATREQLETAFDSLVHGKLPPFETDAVLEAFVCNDAASPGMLEEILKRGVSLSAAAWKASRRRGRRWRRRPGNRAVRDARLTRTIMAALAIHPHTPGELRERLVKDLRRRRVKIVEIRRVNEGGRVGVEFQQKGVRFVVRRRRTHRRLRPSELPVSVLRSRLKGFERRIINTKKALEKRIAADEKKALKQSQKTSRRKVR